MSSPTFLNVIQESGTYFYILRSNHDLNSIQFPLTITYIPKRALWIITYLNVIDIVEFGSNLSDSLVRYKIMVLKRATQIEIQKVIETQIIELDMSIYIKMNFLK